MKSYFKYFLFNSFFLIALVLIVADRFPTYFYSPEEMSIHHNKLTCEACHTPFAGVEPGSCVTAGCHTEKKMNKMEERLAALHDEYKKESCMECHTDHVKAEGKVSLMLNHEFLKGWPKDQCLPCHEGDDSDKTHYKKYYSKDCASCHTLFKWTIEGFDHDKLLNRDQCWDCHFPPKDIMHDTEQNCLRCHTSTTEWIEGYAEIQQGEPESNPQEGIETFFSWGELSVDGSKFERNEKAIKKWAEKLREMEKISEIKVEGGWTSVLEEGDAIYIKRKGRDDPIYKAVVKVFVGKQRRILFSIDDDFGRIMEKAIPGENLDDPILKEIFESGYLEKGGAKSSLAYAKYLIETEEESLARPGTMVRKIMIDPTAKDFIYSGDAASGIDSDF